MQRTPGGCSIRGPLGGRGVDSQGGGAGLLVGCIMTGELTRGPSRRSMLQARMPLVLPVLPAGAEWTRQGEADQRRLLPADAARGVRDARTRPVSGKHRAIGP